MAKYNITAKKEKDAAYRNMVSPALMDLLQAKIHKVIVDERKFLDKDYSIDKLAKDVGTNTRYVSAVISVRLNENYSSYVNKYRIEEAVRILSNEENRRLSIIDVSDMVGFSNRQSFYAWFYRLKGITPRQFKIQTLPPKEKPKPKAKKKKYGKY
ncbi:MAG: helix-turn-helix transcriptional regulator [Prevotella sp.]|nr:helix-turn-helix transcriptional regulator [Prevotella sp.]